MNQNPDKLVPALIGGAIMAGLTVIPVLNFINCMCCAGIILGGYFAVFFYLRNLPDDAPISYSDGALLGILAGVFGTLFSAALNMIIGNNFDQVMEQLTQYMNEIPPEMEEILYLVKENQGAFMLASMAMSLVVDILFGLLGGLIGVAIMGKKRLQM